MKAAMKVANVKMKMKMETIRLALLVVGMSVAAAAQSADQAPPSATPAPTPAPAFGQNAPVLNPENPPVTGLDVPSLDLRVASRSFFAPAFQVSESADTNGGNQLGAGTNGLESITRVLGAFDLQKFWPRTDAYLEYLGGGAFYSSPFDARQMQAAAFEGVERWRTGQATLRDSFSYLPDGSFQIGYGGDPGLGLITGGLGVGVPGTVPLNNGSAGSVGNIPRLANVAVFDVVQALNPRSAVTAAGGFSNAHFYDPTDTLINSNEYTAEGGYSHLISRRDQLGVVYAFQLFQFPQATGGEIYVHVVNLRWSHTISGRLSFIVGVGPQYTELNLGNPPQTHLEPSGRAMLRYKLRSHGSLFASYEKYISPGSGFFAGADTQMVRVGFTRRFQRTWELFADVGYSHNKRLQESIFGATTATSYDEGSAGTVIRRHLGRSYDVFATYRFLDMNFNEAPGFSPGLGVGNGTVAHRHIGTIGVEWHPRPTRID